MKKSTDTIVDDVLYAFSVEKNRSKDTLEQYVQKYPEYKDELIDLSIELLSISTEEKFSRPDISESALMAWDKFQEMLPSSDPLSSDPNDIDPLVVLDRPAFRSLAKKLDISSPLLAMLRDKTVKGSTIPNSFIKLIADAVGQSTDVMRTVLNRSPIISSSTSFKADAAPVVENQITFDEAINNSGLSEQQKATLLAMKD